MVAVVCDDLLRFYVVDKVYNVLPTLNQFLDTRYAIRLREFGYRLTIKYVSVEL